jgi:hypothetical protein
MQKSPNPLPDPMIDPANKLPPLPIQGASFAASVPVTVNAAQEHKGPAKSITGIIIGLAVFFIIVIALALGGGYGYSLLRRQYIPLLSPAFEGLVNPPYEQLAQRTDVYIDVLDAAVKTQSQTGQNTADLSSYQQNLLDLLENIHSLSYTSEIDLSYDLIKAPTEYTPILGLDTAAGTLDQNSLQQILSSKTGTLQIKTDGKYEKAANEKLNLDLSQELGLQAGGTSLGAGYRTLTVSGTDNSEISYLYLDYFPVNPYLVTDSIEKKWIMFPQTASAETASLLPSASTMLTQILPADLNTTIQQIQNLKRVLRTPSFQKAITAAPSETIAGNASKCYDINIAHGDWPAIQADLATIYPDNSGSQATSAAANPLDLKLTLCFDNLNLLLDKVTFSITTDDQATGKVTVAGSVALTDMNGTYNIAAPTGNVINFDQIDLTKVVPLLAINNNQVRTSNLSFIESGFRLYSFNHNTRILPLINIPDCPDTAHIGSSAGNIDLAGILNNEVPAELDPAGGTNEDWGYTMCKSGDTITLQAPLAENGATITNEYQDIYP